MTSEYDSLASQIARLEAQVSAYERRIVALENDDTPAGGDSLVGEAVGDGGIGGVDFPRELGGDAGTTIADGTNDGDVLYWKITEGEEDTGEWTVADMTDIADGDAMAWDEANQTWEPCTFSTCADNPEANVETIGSAAEGNEGEESSTWTACNENEHGLRLYIMSRVAYYHGGTQTLYGYVRRMTFDKCGRLYSVGAETRVTIDVPVVYS